MSVAVPIDNQILEMALGHYEASGEGVESGVFSFDEAAGNEPGVFDPASEYALEMAEDLLKTGVEWFDESAKSRGLSGMGNIPPARYTKVGFMIAKKRIPREWLENSPEFTFTMMTLKILGQNGLELQKIKNHKKDNE